MQQIVKQLHIQNLSKCLFISMEKTHAILPQKAEFYFPNIWFQSISSSSID
jgi:hypothetical protein